MANDPRGAAAASDGPRQQATRVGLGYLFDESLARSPDRVAIIQGETQLTFAELDRAANRVASALAASGIGPGTRVALLFDNDYRFIPCYFGILRAGAIVVPITHRLPDSTVRYVVEHSDTRVLISAPSQVARASRCAGGLIEPRSLLGFERAPDGGTLFEEWVANAAEHFAPISIDLDDIAMHPYTSGSTGRPKGCLLTHGGQLWNVRATTALRDITAEDCTLTAAPLCHKNAMVTAVKPVLYRGGSVVILPSFDARTYLQAIEQHQVTCTTGVPAMYRMLVERAPLTGSVDTSSVRYCFVGSASVPTDLQTAVHRLFPNAHLREAYGSTEGGPSVLAQPPDGSDGLVPVEGTELRVVREDGRECAPNEVGELLVRNAGVLRAYSKDPVTTRERLRDGWYATRDLVRRGDDGRYRIVGRTDDLIKTRGRERLPEGSRRYPPGAPGRCRCQCGRRRAPDEGRRPCCLCGTEAGGDNRRGRAQELLPGPRRGLRPSPPDLRRRSLAPGRTRQDRPAGAPS